MRCHDQAPTLAKCHCQPNLPTSQLLQSPLTVPEPVLVEPTLAAFYAPRELLPEVPPVSQTGPRAGHDPSRAQLCVWQV